MVGGGIVIVKSATPTVNLPSAARDGVRSSLSAERRRLAAADVSAKRAPTIEARLRADASITDGRVGVSVNRRRLVLPMRPVTYEDVRPIVTCSFVTPTLRLPEVNRNEPVRAIFALPVTLHAPSAKVGLLGQRERARGQRALAGGGQLRTRRARACVAEAPAGAAAKAHSATRTATANGHGANPTAQAGNADPNTGS